MCYNTICYNRAMPENIYLQAEELKEKIANDPRVISLNEIEKRMNESEEVMALTYKKDMAAVDYSDTLNHFPEDSKEAKEALKKLHEAKLNLDNHPLVKEYLKAYKEVRELYQNINEIVFGNFSSNLCPKENK